MTRDELVKIIRNIEISICHHALSGSSGEPTIEYDTACQAADRILAAIEKEREGEVVLEPMEICKGRFCGKYFYRDGKRGQLIFRTTKEAK